MIMLVKQSIWTINPNCFIYNDATISCFFPHDVLNQCLNKLFNKCTTLGKTNNAHQIFILSEFHQKSCLILLIKETSSIVTIEITVLLFIMYYKLHTCHYYNQRRNFIPLI